MFRACCSPSSGGNNVAMQQFVRVVHFGRLSAASRRHQVGFITRKNKILALLRCYAAEIGSYFPAFWDNLSIISSRDRYIVPKRR
jgi:hypothetical protein